MEKKLIQAFIDEDLYDKIQEASKKRGCEKVGSFNREILTELDNKGYFDSPLNEIKIIKK